MHLFETHCASLPCFNPNLDFLQAVKVTKSGHYLLHNRASKGYGSIPGWTSQTDLLTNVLTSISERFCPNFEQINIPPLHVGNQGQFSNMSGLSSSTYLTCVKLNWPISNLNVNTRIVQGPLQALLSLAHPLDIRKQISE